MVRKCTICRSRKWHKEPLSGLVVCEEGHVLQNYRSEMNDADDLGRHTMRKRALKSARQKKEKGSKANPKVYHGARARFHYFQCLQLLLRKQVVALTQLWKLPDLFEVVCRDLWALHLSYLKEPLPAEPYFHRLETADESALNPEKDKEGELSSSSSSEEDTEDELERLMEQNSELSSDEDDQDESDPGTLPAVGTQRRTKGKPISETPLSTVVIVVLACWTLRIPILYRDIIRAIESYDLPYLDATRYLPANMTLHLSKANVSSLSPYHSPRSMVLHELAAKFAKRIFADYKVFIPEANAAPILWRTVRAMYGTPTLYSFTKRLAQKLQIPLTLHFSLSRRVPETNRYSPQFHKYDNIPPELAFVAVAVMALKMMYGLDGRPRMPSNFEDPLCAMPCKDDYIGLLRRGEDADGWDAFSSETPLPVGDLETEVLDDYLDFCEQVLVNDGDSRVAGRHLLDDFFPLDASERRRRQDGERKADGMEVKAAIPLAAEDAATGTLRPGEEYMIYSARDVLGDVDGELELVISRAARWAMVEEEEIYNVLEMYERRN